MVGPQRLMVGVGPSVAPPLHPDYLFADFAGNTAYDQIAKQFNLLSI